MKKRSDGRYQKKIILSNGKQKIVYGKTLAELNRNVQDVRDQDSQGLAVNDNTLVGEWAAQWLETYKSSLRAATIAMYRNAYNNHILQYIGDMQLKAVRPVHVQNVINEVADQSESLQRKVLITLDQIFESARHNRLIQSNPVEGIKITKHAAPERKKHLTKEEQDALMEAVTDPRARLFCGLCLYCGLRREEALGVQWGDISGANLTVNRAITFIGNQPDANQELKTKAAHRIIPLIDPMLDILDRTPRAGLYLLTNTDGSMITRIGFRRMWEKVTKSVPFHVFPHMLRHTYATALCLSGVELKRAQYLLGHQSIIMTANVYTHIQANDITHCAEPINDYFAKSSQKVVKTR